MVLQISAHALHLVGYGDSVTLQDIAPDGTATPEPNPITVVSMLVFAKPWVVMNGFMPITISTNTEPRM